MEGDKGVLGVKGNLGTRINWCVGISPGVMNLNLYP